MKGCTTPPGSTSSTLYEQQCGFFHPLTIITWPYRELKFRPIEVTCLLKPSADKYFVSTLFVDLCTTNFIWSTKHIGYNKSSFEFGLWFCSYKGKKLLHLLQFQLHCSTNQLHKLHTAACFDHEKVQKTDLKPLLFVKSEVLHYNSWQFFSIKHTYIHTLFKVS